MAATIPDGSYLALILGAKSLNLKDMLVLQANGDQSDFSDRFGLGFRMPPKDDTQDWTGAFKKLGNEVSFVVERQLTTGD